MGNDSGVRRKHKQRTTIHKKHQAYPGVKLSPEVTLQSGSIKPIKRVSPNTIADAPFKRVEKSPLWDSYDKWAKMLSFNGSSAPLALRNNIEIQYLLAFKRLVKAGEIAPLKRKYRIQQ